MDTYARTLLDKLKAVEYKGSGMHIHNTRARISLLESWLKRLERINKGEDVKCWIGKSSIGGGTTYGGKWRLYTKDEIEEKLQVQIDKAEEFLKAIVT